MGDDKLGGVLNGDKPLMRWNCSDQRLGQGGFAGAGRSRNENVAASSHGQIEELAPCAGFLEGKQAMLVRAELIPRDTDLVEQLCLLEGVERHGQGRWLADRQADCPGRDSRGHHDLAALLADQAGRHHRMFRTDVLAGVTGGGSRQMREVGMRQSRRLVPGPTARPFHEDLARAVDDDFGQGLVRQVWCQRLEIAF